MKKIYCGSWKTRTSQYWDFYTVWLKLEELEKYVNDKGYVDIVINKRQAPDNYWNDLSVVISEYKPNQEQKKPLKPQKNEFWDDIIEDIPF